MSQQTADSSSPAALLSPESDSADLPADPRAPRFCSSAPPAQTFPSRPISQPPPGLARLTIPLRSLHHSSRDGHEYIFQRLAVAAKFGNRKPSQHHFPQQGDFARLI